MKTRQCGTRLKPDLSNYVEYCIRPDRSGRYWTAYEARPRSATDRLAVFVAIGKPRASAALAAAELLAYIERYERAGKGSK